MTIILHKSGRYLLHVSNITNIKYNVMIQHAYIYMYTHNCKAPQEWNTGLLELTQDFHDEYLADCRYVTYMYNHVYYGDII